MKNLKKIFSHVYNFMTPHVPNPQSPVPLPFFSNLSLLDYLVHNQIYRRESRHVTFTFPHVSLVSRSFLGASRVKPISPFILLTNQTITAVPLLNDHNYATQHLDTCQQTTGRSQINFFSLSSILL